MVCLERIDLISDEVYNDILSYYKLPEMPSSLSSYPQLIIDSEKLPVLGGYEKEDTSIYWFRNLEVNFFI